MKILHVAGSLDPKDGGVVRVILNLAAAMAQNNIDVTVLAPSSGNPEQDVNNIPGVSIKYFDKAWFAKLLAGHSLWSGYSPALAKALMKEAGGFDIIHTHSLWHFPHYAAYKAAMHYSKPLMVTVQGELTPWALKQQPTRSIKIQKEILDYASAIQAVSGNEAKNIAKFTDNPNVVMGPNAITPEEFNNPIDKNWLFDAYPQLKNKKIILFLGRINKGKGLEVLAQSFGRVVLAEPDARLLIVGPDAWGYKSYIQKILNKSDVLDRVVFTGQLFGQEKISALYSSNVFVLLSESEAFSLTVLEALYCGLPVIISPECNFAEVGESGAGKIINRDPVELSQKLVELLHDPAACKEMGAKGRYLIEHGGYKYNEIAKKIIGVYSGIINHTRS